MARTDVGLNRWVVLVAALLLSGCGGGANGDNPALPSRPSSNASAAFTIKVPARTAVGAAGTVRPQYISPSTQSVSISVSGVAAPVVANLTPASPNCVPASGPNPLQCTVSVTAPVGNDTFTVTFYSQLNGAGNALSKGAVTANITPHQTTPVNIVTGGIISSIQVVVANPRPALGTAASIPVTVTAKDGNGNVIIAPGNYTTPIQLSDSDTTCTTLSTTTVTSPSTVVTLNYTGAKLTTATISASAPGVPPAQITNALIRPTGFLSYPIPTAQSNPLLMTTGADGNLWFSEQHGVGRITTSGVITEFVLPTRPNGVAGIAAGPDGNVWFTEQFGNKIGRITPAGVFTEFPIRTQNSQPLYIATGPDRNLWFAESVVDKIGRITPAGAITEFGPLPNANSQPQGIGAGPDGNVWFTEPGAAAGAGNRIGRITPRGQITEFPTPTANCNPALYCYQLQIVTGSDGNLWFTEINGNKVDRITTAGAITEFTVPSANTGPALIVPGPGGKLWFTEVNGNRIASLTTSGTFAEYPIPIANSQPSGIAAGPDGNLWFVEAGVNRIGVYVP